MENLTLPFWIVVTLLSALGVGKLLQMGYKATLDRKEVQHNLQLTNAGKQIDADINAFDAINTRLSLVENRLDVVTTQHTQQLVENAKLEAENERLSNDNLRQEKEIERQRDRLHGLANDIQIRDAQISDLRVMLETLRAEVKAMNGGHNNTVSIEGIVNTKVVEEEIE